MLVTDFGDEIYWQQLWDVVDDFGRFRQQMAISQEEREPQPFILLVWPTDLILSSLNNTTELFFSSQ